MSRKVRWMCTVWTYLRRWCVWSLTPVSLPKQPCNILTLMISIRVVSPSELPNSLFELLYYLILKFTSFQVVCVLPSPLHSTYAITSHELSLYEFTYLSSSGELTPESNEESRSSSLSGYCTPGPISLQVLGLL